MTIFTYILDLACHQAFSLLQTIRPRESLSFLEFKRDLCEELVSEFRKRRKRKFEETLDQDEEKLDEEKNIGKKPHMLIENLNKADINCHMCLIRGQKKKTIYGCTICGKGFHVNCFTAFHYENELEGHQKKMTQQLLSSTELTPRGHKKRSKHVGGIESIILFK